MAVKFSVVMITRDEEKTLPRLLSSLEEFKRRGGETIVLDTGSKDNTVKIAKEWGCKVTEVGTRYLHTIDKKMADEINSHFITGGEAPIVKAGEKYFDFSSARNHASSLASNNMVSSADADEEFTKLDIDAIEKMIDEGINQFEYNFVFSHDWQGNEVIKFIQSKFYDRRVMKWVNLVHEVLSGPGNRRFIGEDVLKLEHWQNHETNRHNYLIGLAVDCYLRQDDDRNSHYFARELMWNEHPKSAIKEFERHIAMNRWLAEKAQSMVYVGQCYDMIGEKDKAVEWWSRAFHIDPTRREALMRLARFYLNNKTYQAATCYAMAATQIPWSAFYSNNKGHYTNEPHEILYIANGWMGNIPGAQEHITKALEHQPLNSNYLRDLRYYFTLPTVSFIIPTLGREEGLKKCVDSIKALNYPQELIDIKVLDGEGTVPKKVKKGVAETQGEYIVYGANDCVFTPDSLILALREAQQTKKRLIAFDTGVRNSEGFINEHFMIKRDLIPEIGGEIFDTDFFHVGVDDLLWKKCMKLGEATICKGMVEHKHFSRMGSGIEQDEINKLGWSHADQDRALLKKKLAKL